MVVLASWFGSLPQTDLQILGKARVHMVAGIQHPILKATTNKTHACKGPQHLVFW